MRQRLIDIKMLTLKYEKEVELFNQRNQDFIELFPLLKDAVSEISKQISATNKAESIILMLGRVCFWHYEAIVFLCLNGFGFRAMGELRGLFEKCVDTTYLTKNPNEIDDFIDYEFVQLVKTGFQEKAEEIDPKYEDRVKKFKTKKSWKNSWSKLSIVKRAKSVGIEDRMITEAYVIPNEYVHTSCAELELSLTVNSNGVKTPVDSENPAERKLADIAFRLASLLFIEVLDTQIDYFNLDKNQKLEDYVSKFEQLTQASEQPNL
jgi:Family of unknown function (DUF5677)